MARIRTSAVRPLAWPHIVRSPFAWWVEAASDPSTALAALIAGLVLWQGRSLLGGAAMLVTRTVASLRPLEHLPLPAAFDLSHSVGWAIMLVTAFAATWGSWVLYHWTERTFATTAARARR